MSPFNLLQEQQVDKPYPDWRILVVCALLNRTHGRQVRPIVDRLFELAPTPTDMIDRLDSPEVEQVLRPLGLVNRRRAQLQSICQEYLWRRSRVPASADTSGEWAHALSGCGQYAVDSLNLVLYGVLGTPTTDTWLRRYAEWRRSLPV